MKERTTLYARYGRRSTRCLLSRARHAPRCAFRLDPAAVPLDFTVAGPVRDYNGPGHDLMTFERGV
ncbi:hypothetical protein Drose_22025 [Dactylosporangium roseum]|uniref:Uncharacterized protein n=1 Tax=Dactylosporangium roseum TaxID=47989 RepID=A0ABY5YYK6_9ACTN|nr:hypothetical protein [Dactylosporangium roseum]UWZ33943.1 hypothetical protein Drose_22025 [Dactylosporangium roseum]